MQRYHFFGCAPLERGSDASHLTCNAWRAIHSSPRTIACCYEGNFCNENLTLPDLPALELTPDDLNFPSRHGHSTAFSAPFAFLLFGFFVGLCLLLAFAVPIQCWLRKKNGKEKGILVDDIGSSSTESGTLLKKCQDNSQFLKQQQTLGFEQSSSGSGGLALVQRSIALDLRMLEVFARGRYGELRKALYRGTVVAVKVFYTTEEESWLNERDIYQSQMLNHENILRENSILWPFLNLLEYVAADILSSVESLTQMMLITDFHHLGSLYDYLRAGTLIELDEALQLALSSISGLEHLHNALRGTAGRTKPEIAHRDIKSKNVLVKRRGVCCLADFGLAVRFEKGEIIPSRVNIKRYMAPELLLGTLNVQNFDGFKSADIYSFALVLWEILNRVQMKDSSSCALLPPAFPPASSVVFPSSPTALPLHVPGGVRHQWIANSRSSGGGSSGFASSGCSADRTFAPFTNSLTMSGQHCQPHLQHYQQLFGAVQQQQGRQLVVMTETGGEDGKWRADSSESATQSQQQQQREHALPYRGMVDNDPSFEQMRQIVCVQKLRPPMESEWTDCANALMSSLCLLITECWSEQPRSRHTALKVKKELMALIQRLRKEGTTAATDREREGSMLN
uniref:receptor protein serine/threonine kinase n=1 Tax=Globodera pallida TaxID=36090 RepID=A0A183C3J0_GLOPA